MIEEHRVSRFECDWGPETRAIHGAGRAAGTHSLTAPIVQTTTFRLDSAQHGGELAVTTAPAEFYTRWGNPTTKQFEAVAASLERCEAALATASGMGAISMFLLAHLQAGDHFIAGKSIYSGVNELARGILPRYGIESTFADARDLAAVESARRKNTKLIIVESPTNPTLELCDLEALGRWGREHGVLTAVDNTFASPINQNPTQLGIDVTLHAATKSIGGHSDATGGLICSRLEIVERCWPYLKLFGPCLSPFEAWLFLRGLKTLAERIERQNRSAMSLARFLESHPKVARVHYPGLESHPDYELAQRQMRGAGGILSFEVAGGRSAGVRVVESLRLIQLAVSLGGVESIVQHPASMTHGTLPEEEIAKAGIAPGLMRLSVGLETEEDLRADLERALGAA